MSTIAEKAREEADRVEAEYPDDDEGDGDETDADDADDASEIEPPSGHQVDVAKVEKELERHRRELGKLFGPIFAEMQPCTRCGDSLPGFEPPDAGPQLAASTTTEPCPTCNGFGLVRSGSHNPAFELIDCTDCMGKGYRQVSVSVGGASILAQPGQNAGNAIVLDPHAAGAPPLPPDAWGRPSGHPHYGIPPANVGA